MPARLTNLELDLLRNLVNGRRPATHPCVQRPIPLPSASLRGAARGASAKCRRRHRLGMTGQYAVLRLRPATTTGRPRPRRPPRSSRSWRSARRSASFDDFTASQTNRSTASGQMPHDRVAWNDQAPSGHARPFARPRVRPPGYSG